MLSISMYFVPENTFSFEEENRAFNCLKTMYHLTKSSDGEFWKRALQEYMNSNINDKIDMCKYLLHITEDLEYMDLQTAIILSAYPA